ncbi:MAG: hypothetical protein HY314_15145 [Acidobacteria bacterium]|nr:hypothetical protein [Acidobacteriota bacterium]
MMTKKLVYASLICSLLVPLLAPFSAAHGGAKFYEQAVQPEPPMLQDAAGVLASAGDLDPTFGPNANGRVTTGFFDADDQANAVALQPNGRIVAAGSSGSGGNADIALVRYTPKGSLDPTFGGSGQLTLTLGGDQVATALALTSDGKIVVAGYAKSSTESNYNFFVARFKGDGNLDGTFNFFGLAITDFGVGDDFARAVAIQPDGKIVSAGQAWNGREFDFALARYNVNGTLDSSFGTGGKVNTSICSRCIGGSDDWAYALALQPNGKIVVAGSLVAGSAGARNDFALVRYNANGTLDTSFGGGDGIVTTDFVSGGDHAAALVIQPDGKLVVAGRSTSELERIGPGNAPRPELLFALARYNSDGTLDASFGRYIFSFPGNVGRVTTAIGKFASALALALQADGKILAAGYRFPFPSGYADFAVVRYNPDGTRDSIFGLGAGIVTTDFSARDDFAYAVAIGTDNKIVVAGSAFNGRNRDFALARYLGGV